MLVNLIKFFYLVGKWITFSCIVSHLTKVKMQSIFNNNNKNIIQKWDYIQGRLKQK